SWISKRGSAPSRASVMCSAFMSGIPMYVAGSPPSMVATWPLRNPRSSKKPTAASASATATVMWSGLRNMDPPTLTWTPVGPDHGGRGDHHPDRDDEGGRRALTRRCSADADQGVVRVEVVGPGHRVVRHLVVRALGDDAAARRPVVATALDLPHVDLRQDALQ